MRRAIFLAAFCIGLATPSYAGEPFRPQTVTPLGPHSCAGFYPEAELQAHVEGEVSLAFHIMPSGIVSNVAVAKSSGNADLDDAAKICVRTWRYAPVLKDGTAAEASWSAKVEWRAEPAVATPSGPMPVLLAKDPGCLRYPWWAKKDRVEGNAKLSYVVAPDGSVGNVGIAKSSGNSDLDGAAMDCVKSLKYRPHSGGDAPKALKADVVWSTLAKGPYVVNWYFEGAITEVVEAAQHLKSGIIQCLRGASGHADFASGFGGATTVWVRYDRGEIAAVSVLHPSGNDALDQFALDCFQSQPHDPERAEAMRHIGNSNFTIVWRLYVNR